MKFFEIFAVICIIALMNINIYAQESDDKEDTTEENVWNDDFSMKFSVSRPTLEITYGMGEPSIHKDLFKSGFEPTNSLEVKLGFAKKESEIFEEDIYDYSYSFISFQNITSNWNKTKDETSAKINTDAWQFGLGTQGGYGYKLGEKTDLSLYHSGAWVWTKIDFMDTTAIPEDQKRMDYFGDSFRFGNYFEGGINFQVYEPVAITLAYQQTVVFPRHMFWKWTLSGIVEGIGSGAISWFSGKVLKSSPTWGPIVYFVLKNVYSYGFNQLRKKNMNWPMNTEAPLMYDNYKIGLSFSF
ncbi:MAG: hypothetical protein V1779_09450 [bacterium]